MADELPSALLLRMIREWDFKMTGMMLAPVTEKLDALAADVAVWRGSNGRLDRIESLLNSMRTEIMATFQEIVDQASKNAATDRAGADAITALLQKVIDAVAGGATPAQLTALLTTMQDGAAPLSAAIANVNPATPPPVVTEPPPTPGDGTTPAGSTPAARGSLPG